MKPPKRKPQRQRTNPDAKAVETLFAILPRDILRTYIRTRRLPDHHCVSLFRNIFAKRPAHLLDVGCGIGRLAIPIAEAFPAIHVLGIDVSATAIARARSAALRAKADASRLQFQTAEVLQFAAHRDGSALPYQYVLCHWCFHCVYPWRSVVLACLRCCDMTSNPRLFWLAEDSELYRALDNLSPDGVMGEKWSRFWRHYHMLRTRLEPDARSEHRMGTLLRCTDEIRTVLLLLGWNVDNDSKHTEDWQEHWRYGEIIDDCLAPRAFTNLQRLDAAGHAKIIAKLRSSLGRDGLPRDDEEVAVPYSVRLVTAYPGPEASSFQDASLHILSLCADIAEEATDLSLFARIDHQVVPVLRAALANFFALLFEPTVAPRWRPFWDAPPGASAGDNAPQWVWIRFLAGSHVGFDQFLRDRLWAHSAQPKLFDAVLAPYFRTRATFAHLAFSRMRNRGRPLIMRILPGVEAGAFDVRDSGKQIEIQIPKAFVDGPHGYCADVTVDLFAEDVWTSNSRDHQDALFGSGAGDEQKRIAFALTAFCQKLDSVLGVSMYERDPRRFVSVVQATKLFPGDAYCFFPVRDAHGNLVSSVTMGLRNMPTTEQITVLRDCIDRLLKVPSLILTSGTRGRRARNV